MALESNPTSEPYSQEYEDLVNDTQPTDEAELFKKSEASP